MISYGKIILISAFLDYSCFSDNNSPTYVKQLLYMCLQIEKKRYKLKIITKKQSNVFVITYSNFLHVKEALSLIMS